MENKSVDSADGVVRLVLDDGRSIEANKEKLANYSIYFASLFSENFKDHIQNEYKINYDISLETLTNFVSWINSEGEHTRVVHSKKYFFFVRESLEKFLNPSHYPELLQLLELSVIFMTEKLTENIVEIIICMRLSAEDMLGVWFLAQDLGLKVLRDVALATCLDRFEEIQLSSIAELPINMFFKLVLNVNVRSTTSRLLAAREEWNKHNDIPKNLPHSYVQFLTSDPNDVTKILDEKRPHYIQCVAGHKLSKSLGIWSWNGKILQELTEITDSQMHTTFHDNGKEISGRQVIGRGFSIYLIGGEQGIGSGRFNPALWRYCPFSKKWYTEALLPRLRRHMAVAFLDNKLYIFGGIGRHRLKLSCVDVYNVHTGEWSKAAEIPEVFTDVPPSCVVNNKFIYYKSFYYGYDPILNDWSLCNPKIDVYDSSNLMDFPINPEDQSSPELPIRSLVGQGNTDSNDKSVVYVTHVNRCTKRTILKKTCLLWSWCDFLSTRTHEWSPEDDVGVIDQQIINWPYLVSFAHSDDATTVEVGELRTNCSIDDGEELGEMRSDTYHRLKIYSTKLNNVTPNTFKLRLGCFNMINPETLHTVIRFPEEESISV